MTLHQPTHIVAANVANDELLYPWDESDISESYEAGGEDVFPRLEKVSDRGNTALAIACGEWIYHRFTLLNNDGEPLSYLEAAWAGNVFLSYSIYTENDDDKWRGLVRGPLNMTMTLINDALWCRDEDEVVANRSTWMINLTRLVLPPGSLPAFEAWLEAVVLRLETHCAMPPPSTTPPSLFPEEDEAEDVGGEQVPRELFEPEQPFDPSSRDALVDQYLRGLAPDENQYLRSEKWIKRNTKAKAYQYPSP